MKFFRDERARLIEDALTLPVLLLVTVAMLNVFMYGLAGISAANAAEYAARQATVAQANQQAVAVAAARGRLEQLPIGAQFHVSATAPARRGARVTVTVTYDVPNWFRGLAAMFGVDTPPTLHGQAVSYFRKEGW